MENSTTEACQRGAASRLRRRGLAALLAAAALAVVVFVFPSVM